MMIPALLVTGGLVGEEDGTMPVVACANKNGNNSPDTGCNADKPICVNANQQQPALYEPGLQCVPCVNHHELPMEPDRGCSSDRPLCVADNNVRPQAGQAGNKCVSYPCHATPGGIDVGCTTHHPICVDGLGKEPSLGQPGVECISSVDTTAKKAWGITSTNRRELSYSDDEPSWGWLSKRSTQNKQDSLMSCSTSVKAGHFSFCNSCPFSQPGNGCDMAKLSW